MGSELKQVLHKTFFILLFIGRVFLFKAFLTRTNMRRFQCDALIRLPHCPRPNVMTSGQEKKRAPSQLTVLCLPRGEKGAFAMESLCEGVAQCDHASLPAWAAALHHHPRHLHQLDRTLPILECLGQVQHLGGKKTHVLNIQGIQKLCRAKEYLWFLSLCVKLQLQKVVSRIGLNKPLTMWNALVLTGSLIEATLDAVKHEN